MFADYLALALTVLAYTHSSHLPEAKNKTLNFIKRKKLKVND
jgi:hypothetical protein